MKPKKDESAWARKIAEEFGKDIKILKNFGKGELAGGGTVQVRVPANWISQDSTMVFMSKGELRNTTEVWRAQLYIGRRILYHLVSNGTQNNEDTTLWNIMEQEEKSSIEAQTSREIINRLVIRYELMQGKYLTKEEFDDFLKKVLGAVNPNIRKRIEDAISEIDNGALIWKHLVDADKRGNLTHLEDKRESNEWS